jgi:hypothetical protein
MASSWEILVHAPFSGQAMFLDSLRASLLQEVMVWSSVNVWGRLRMDRILKHQEFRIEGYAAVDRFRLKKKHGEWVRISLPVRYDGPSEGRDFWEYVHAK